MIRDRELDDMLRMFLADEGREASRTAPTLEMATSRLAARLGPAKARSRSLWATSPTLRIGLVLMALLVIMSIGIAVVGGLLRNDRTKPLPFLLAGPVAHCDPALPDTVQLSVRGFAPNEDWPDATELTVYGDGLAVIGPSAEWGGSADTLEAQWSQRRLTAEGVRRLVGAATEALPACQSFAFDGQIAIRARAGDDVVSMTLGTDVLETRVTTATEVAAVNDLAERLADPDLGLSTGDWADDQWTAYVPERWRFSLQFSGPSERGYPTSDGIALPDGSTLETFGSEEDVRSMDPAAVAPGLTMLRCAITDAEEARAIATILTDAGDAPTDPTTSGWGFTNSEGVVWVSVVGLLPHEPNCLADVEAGPSPTPAPAPSAPVDGPAPLVDACEYVSAQLIGDLIGPIEGETEHYPGWSTDWAFCWQPVAGDGVAIAASRRSVPGERAADQARSLFGEVGFSAEQIAGHDVFFNGCELEGQCRAAVAISAEPHFVVVLWRGGSHVTLSDIAERVIQDLDAAD